jgi:hypothetical protein
MKAIFLIVSMLLSLSLSAQYDNIRQYMAPKYQNAITTVEMRQAASAEGEIWQNLREVVYEQLYQNLSKEGKAAFEQRRAAWETYMEAENAYLTQLYFGELQGSMWYPVSDRARAVLYKERTEKLLEDFDLLVRSQGDSDLPPELILGKWTNSNGQNTFSFYDNFTAFEGVSVSTGLLFYKIALEDNALLLTLFKAEDLSIKKQFEILGQSYQEMRLKDGDQKLVFRRVN